MSPEAITEIMQKSEGNLTNHQCRCIVHYMMGYIRHAQTLEAVRDEFFRQIKSATEGQSVPVWP